MLEEINKLSQLIRSPFDLSHMVLIGHAFPDPLIHLAAANCGYTLVRPSFYFSPSLLTTACSLFGMSPASYCETRLKTDLCTLYTETGVKVFTMVPLCVALRVAYCVIVPGYTYMYVYYWSPYRTSVCCY